MARTLDTIPADERPVPILSSPHSALDHLDRLIAARAPEPEPEV